MNIVKSSQSIYGYSIGIIMLDCSFPRIPGDIGNATTFNFPVLYRIIRGVSFQKIINKRDKQYLKPFISAARELEKQGVKAITTSCGFLAVFQQILSEAVKIPLFSSSLIQVPLVYEMLGRRGKIGILTSDSNFLSEDHFMAVGWSSKDIPIAIASMQQCKEFNRVILRGQELPMMDASKIEAEVVSVIKKLIIEEPDVRALVIECTNLPPFASAIQKETGLFIFDIVTLTKMVHEAAMRTVFTGFL
jgi:Asp/Glu/hydantoin racemase